MCQLRLLAFAGMIGREGSSRLHHSDQEMGDPSVLERSLRRRHPPTATDGPPPCRRHTRRDRRLRPPARAAASDWGGGDGWGGTSRGGGGQQRWRRRRREPQPEAGAVAAAAVAASVPCRRRQPRHPEAPRQGVPVSTGHPIPGGVGGGGMGRSGQRGGRSAANRQAASAVMGWRHGGGGSTRWRGRAAGVGRGALERAQVAGRRQRQGIGHMQTWPLPSPPAPAIQRNVAPPEAWLSAIAILNDPPYLYAVKNVGCAPYISIVV